MLNDEGRVSFSSQAQWQDWGRSARVGDILAEVGDGKGWFLQEIYFTGGQEICPKICGFEDFSVLLSTGWRERASLRGSWSKQPQW